MSRRWLFAVPFLSALFWGSCRDTSNHPLLPLPSGTEMDIRYAICAWATGMILVISLGVAVQAARESTKE